MTTIEWAGPSCRYILAGPFNVAAQWAAKENLHLSEWCHHPLSRSRPDWPTLRVYKLVEEGSEDKEDTTQARASEIGPG